MAPLLFCLYLSAMSKLLSASSKPTSTPSGLSFNPLENRSAFPTLFPQVYFPKKEIVKAYHQYAFFVIAREEPVSGNDYFSEPISNMK